MTHNTDQHHAPMSGQSAYTQADADELARRGDAWIAQRAFQRILEYAKAAETAYPASPNVTLVREIAEMMLGPDPSLRSLERITYREERST